MEISVSVIELYDRLKEMVEDGMDFVTVSVVEADEDVGDPACLMFEAWSKEKAFMGVQYDSVDAVSPSD